MFPASPCHICYFCHLLKTAEGSLLNLLF